MTIGNDCKQWLIAQMKHNKKKHWGTDTRHWEEVTRLKWYSNTYHTKNKPKSY